MGKNTGSKSLIYILKILVPVLFIIFVFLTNYYHAKEFQDGTYKILNDDEYIINLVSDIENSKKSVTCALFMFKVDDYNLDDPQQPISLITKALINAAKNNKEINIIFEKSKDDNDLSNKYNTKTAKYLKDNGINIFFDNESKKLHAKLCLIDDKIIYTGSHNFTFSAMKRNSESSVRIVSKKEAKKVKEYLQNLI